MGSPGNPTARPGSARRSGAFPCRERATAPTFTEGLQFPEQGLTRGLPAGRHGGVGGRASDEFERHGGRLLGGIGRNLRALALSPLVSQRLLAILVEPSRGDLEELARRVEAGALRPHVERAHPLEEAARALRDLESGRVRGKRVLLPGGGS